MESALNSILAVTLFVMVFLGVLLFRNSRKERRENKQLTEMNESLTIKDANKDQFLSFATHQLRSPLTSIKWGLDSLKEKHSLETVNHLLNTTNDLISTVNDLLDISKIEQGGMVMKIEEFDLHDFVGRIVEEFRLTAENKGLKIIFSGDNISCFVRADETKLRQVLVNLIDNAIKYTKAGEITVTFKKVNKNAEIEIKDTGPGIAKEELKDLFDKFLRGAAGKASKGGSGLGLYLAKQIIEAHKGEIKADSDGLGQGSVFTVVFPIKG